MRSNAACRRYVSAPSPSDGALSPQRCIETYYLNRTHLELIAECKLRQCQLTEDGNVRNHRP
jgi:hypothetical protein